MVIAFVATFPGGHDAVHSLVEILVDLPGLLYLVIACLNGSGDKAVGELQGADTFKEQIAPIQKGILGGGNYCHIVRHVVADIHLLKIPITAASSRAIRFLWFLCFIYVPLLLQG